MKSRIFGIALVVLLFVLPVPGTLALRNVLLLLLVALFALSWRECRPEAALRAPQTAGLLVWLAILSAWVVGQALWLSDETAWALKEILNQWLPALLSAAIGLGAVVLGRLAGVPRRQLLAGIILVLLAQAVFALVVTLPDFFADGAFPQSKTRLTAGKLEISYWNNLLLAFLAVDGLSRWLFRQSLSSLPTPAVVAGIVVVFASNLAFGARNGVIGSLLLLASLLFLVLWHKGKTGGRFNTFGLVGGAVVLAGTLAWSSYQLDPRWATLGETARVAWQVEDSDIWLHPDDVWSGPKLPLPQLKSGAPVEPSAYFRVAWIRAGLDMIEKYPLGVGYGRNAFGHALRKTMETRLGHAHSGLIDWTVGVGIPGLLLWLGFLAWLAGVGVRRYFVRKDPAGLVLTFVVGGFFGRMLLDSINRDHMLMVFFLVLAILVSLPEEPVQQ